MHFRRGTYKTARACTPARRAVLFVRSQKCDHSQVSCCCFSSASSLRRHRFSIEVVYIIVVCAKSITSCSTEETEVQNWNDRYYSWMYIIYSSFSSSWSSRDELSRILRGKRKERHSFRNKMLNLM